MFNLPIPIVGLRHHMKDAEAFVRQLPEGQEVVLLHEDSNPFDPQAISAWINEEKVGYVSADFAELLRQSLPDEVTVRAEVCHPIFLPLGHTGFYAQVAMQQLQLPPYQQQISCGPIADLPLPHFRTPRLLRMQKVWQELDEVVASVDANKPTDNLYVQLRNLAERFLDGFGESLDGDEQRLYLHLLLCTAGLTQYPLPEDNDLLLSLMDAMEQLAGVRRHHAASEEQCLEIFLHEKEAVRAQSDTFLQQYDALLKSGFATRKKEIDAHKRWLRALPNRVYSVINRPGLFASRLHYLRLSAEELHAVLLHLICLEHLEGSGGTGHTLEQRIAAFPFWMPESLLSDRRNAIRKLEKALQTPRNATSAFALALKYLLRDNVIRRDVKPHSKLCRALNQMLGSDIKPDSLKRHFHEE